MAYLCLAPLEISGQRDIDEVVRLLFGHYDTNSRRLNFFNKANLGVAHVSEQFFCAGD